MTQGWCVDDLWLSVTDREHPPISEYAKEHPELADEIRDLFPTLAMVEELGPAPAKPIGEEAPQLSAATLPSRLGEYRIIGEIGHGGMGTVYEAEQESLGRRVALKVLPAQAARDPTHLKRFHREARAAARLHHTNIVPVFDVGEQDGIHYYAMQSSRGRAWTKYSSRCVACAAMSDPGRRRSPRRATRSRRVRPLTGQQLPKDPPGRNLPAWGLGSSVPTSKWPERSFRALCQARSGKRTPDRQGRSGQTAPVARLPTRMAVRSAKTTLRLETRRFLRRHFQRAAGIIPARASPAARSRPFR